MTGADRVCYCFTRKYILAGPMVSVAGLAAPTSVPVMADPRAGVDCKVPPVGDHGSVSELAALETVIDGATLEVGGGTATSIVEERKVPGIGLSLFAGVVSAVLRQATWA